MRVAAMALACAFAAGCGRPSEAVLDEVGTVCLYGPEIDVASVFRCLDEQADDRGISRAARIDRYAPGLR